MNNKGVVILICVLSTVFFVWLGLYAWTHRYGADVLYDVNEPQQLTVPLKQRALALKPEDLYDEIWADLPTSEVPLFGQVTEKPWPKGVTRSVSVQAFHDATDIYFRLSWEDDMQNDALAVDSFSDGCAIAIPLDPAAPLRSIMMGFSSPVNLWHWQAHKDTRFWEGRKVIPAATESDFTYPFEDKETLPVSSPELSTAVCDLLAQRAGSLTPKEKQIVQGRGLWQSGRWTVVYKRPLRTADAERDCQFATRRQMSSFAVWDGDQQDRGARKSISDWVVLDLEQKNTSKTAASSREAQGTPVQNQVVAYRRPFSFLSSANAQSSEIPASDPPQQTPRVIDIVAKRFEYIPHRVDVRKGERVTLRLESLDVTHGLYLDGYGIKIKARPGLIGKATFVADKTGRFSFRCSETCGEFHPYMIGHFDVSPNSRFGIFTGAVGVLFVVLLGIAWPKGSNPAKGVDNNG